MALKNFARYGEFDESVDKRIHESVELGIEWLVKLQNRDQGWPTFCRGWGTLPFDRSSADITAHCLRGLSAWLLTTVGTIVDSETRPRVVNGPRNWQRAARGIERGFRFLSKVQRADGSWLPLW